MNNYPKNVPERIFLVMGSEDVTAEDDFNELDEITWNPNPVFKNDIEYVRKKNMKTWHIKTWGGGTPHYLVSAETKEEAWKMVEEEWRNKFNTMDVGGRTSYFFDTEIYVHQNMDDLIEIKGLTTGTKLIIDLNES